MFCFGLVQLATALGGSQVVDDNLEGTARESESGGLFSLSEGRRDEEKMAGWMAMDGCAETTFPLFFLFLF